MVETKKKSPQRMLSLTELSMNVVGLLMRRDELRKRAIQSIKLDTLQL
jgi:hypothetical protein